MGVVTELGIGSTMQDDQIAHDIAMIRQRLGPLSEKAFRQFVDLGLDDREIGRYCSIPPATVSVLRMNYHIPTPNEEANRAISLIDEVDKSDTVKSGLRQFALAMRSKLFGGQ